MITENTLTIFLTSGVNIKLKAEDKLYGLSGYNLEPLTFEELCEYLDYCISSESIVKFKQIMKHQHEEGEQDITHIFHLPHDRISWYMVEEV